MFALNTATTADVVYQKRLQNKKATLLEDVINQQQNISYHGNTMWFVYLHNYLFTYLFFFFFF